MLVLKLLLWSIISGLSLAEQVWRNSNAIRTIDLRSTYTKTLTSLIIVNEGDEPQNTYRYFQQTSPGESVLSLSVSIKEEEKKGTNPIKVNNNVYDIPLQPPVKPGESRTLLIQAGLDGGVRPLPAAVDQDEEQYLVYLTTLYLDSPYTTDLQRTRLILPSAKIDTYTTYNIDGAELPNRVGNTLVYESRETITGEDNDLGEIYVRYEHTVPIPRGADLYVQIDMHEYRKMLEVSERVVFENHAAKLKSNFDRAKWYMGNFYNPVSTAINRVVYSLPRNSKDVYYTDEVGNITTSHMRVEPHQTWIELNPRYPVFGGWNYLFQLDWKMPYEEFRSSKNRREYLDIPLAWSPGDMIYEKAVWSYVFPEGATNIEIEMPVEISNSNVTKIHKFLDTLGRQVFTYEALNVTDGVPSDIVHISYEYNSSAFFLRIAIITTLLILLAAAAYMIWAP
ncbi:dolichyl-diphospho-oligosaccharide-protein glycosyltransferase Ost1 [Schizosaccharomyces pombe]|uniref:Dolichyl-diphosphooligosaccharide--protein glycosyltransferase subunit 1 n=1 Tax=Schizosaccharomyces pombe (strain 972 / ATCC 24843) TaxID=284812 RepID=OST1_SCHPO|nr:putative dolichyl-diphosphooligosaccharide--protein glycosyltransferase Ost1 [Schizosaccharomyces pombe]Q10176.1 RecName: Full=Dolichyl-diphosphooligosaccharide--protein glycosyltransferase subunit 1; AltName: Full=Oligosaccharyl transferase subunit alpha; Flags: Precursor [Schizosaccharomyces pombe 972h-]CAA93296.1 dolichyl-diphospho-oligosaccharide-protein glycosyltransferase Ost1 (predicted) [Schizosaccharomyces pombe]|eukprot:NP_594536.1 putative dolichyl-diphosphooligosaccharide--protein glycosyltransferase Ost1 [Schizosaccharomyces pombe]